MKYFLPKNVVLHFFQRAVIKKNHHKYNWAAYIPFFDYSPEKRVPLPNFA